MEVKPHIRRKVRKSSGDLEFVVKIAKNGASPAICGLSERKTAEALGMLVELKNALACPIYDIPTAIDEHSVHIARRNGG